MTQNTKQYKKTGCKPVFLFKAICKFFDICVGDVGAQVSAEDTVGVLTEIIAARANAPVKYRALFDDAQIVGQNFCVNVAAHEAAFLCLDYELLGFFEDGHIHGL